MTIASSVKLAGGTLSVQGRTVLSGVPASVVASSAAAGGAVDGVFIGAEFVELASRHVISLGSLRSGVPSHNTRTNQIFKGLTVHGVLPVQAVVDGAADGGQGRRRPARDAVSPRRVQRRCRRRRGPRVRRVPPARGGCVPGQPPGRRRGWRRAGALRGERRRRRAGPVLRPRALRGRRRVRPLRRHRQRRCRGRVHAQDVPSPRREDAPRHRGLLRVVHVGRLLPGRDAGGRRGRTSQPRRRRRAAQIRHHRRRLAVRRHRSIGCRRGRAAAPPASAHRNQGEHQVPERGRRHRGGGARGEGGTRAQVRVRLARHRRLLGRRPAWRRRDGAVPRHRAVPGDLAGRRGERPRDEDGLDHRAGSGPRAPARRVPVLRRAARVPRGRRGGRRQGRRAVHPGDARRRQWRAREAHETLDASVAKNFPENGIIACMRQNTDALYCSKQTAVVRASDDFFPRDPVSHMIHIAAVAYNSVFLGEFMLPDLDMFHSLHPAGEYHGSARAISGGPVYVSDAPGKHDFELLKKIVLPDGTVLRARLPARPTKDCLFTDPARDGVSLLKIWNMNKFTGVLGVYNCQGAAWDSVEKKTMLHQTGTEALSFGVKGSDIHLISEAATDPEWNGDCAVYHQASGSLVVLLNGAALPVSLKVLEQDILTVSPIRELAAGFSFAPIGLVDMFNSGAAVEGLSYHILDGANLLGNSGSTSSSEAVALVSMEARGCGRFGAYSSIRPRNCLLGSAQVDFSYDSSSGLMVLQLKDMPKERVHKIVVEL